MAHIKALTDLNLTDSWLSIGSFDGVHQGHQTLIKTLVEQAHQANSLAVVITFFPHPLEILRNSKDSFYLTSPEKRAQLLCSLGIDRIITVEFTHELAEMSADEFLSEIKKHLGMSHLLVGPDFSLGKNRQGNISWLIDQQTNYQYSLQVVQPTLTNGEKISSSQIRKLITKGNIREATRLTGRLYEIEGVVVEGDKRGRTLGFPTANLQVWAKQLLPQSGVYATLIYLDGKAYPSVTNIGIRPTFRPNDVERRVETNILDFNQDIYGRHARLEFVDFIRPEVKFNSIQELISQIQKDVQNTREVLHHVP